MKPDGRSHQGSNHSVHQVKWDIGKDQGVKHALAYGVGHMPANQKGTRKLGHGRDEDGLFEIEGSRPDAGPHSVCNIISADVAGHVDTGGDGKNQKEST